MKVVVITHYLHVRRAVNGTPEIPPRACRGRGSHLHHLVGEAHALLADDVVDWDPDVLEEDLGRVRAAHAHLIDSLGDGDAWRSTVESSRCPTFRVSVNKTKLRDKLTQ